MTILQTEGVSSLTNCGLRCPHCAIIVSTAHNLRKHLTGKTGIHRLSESEADDIIADARLRARHPDLPPATRPLVSSHADTSAAVEIKAPERPTEPHNAFLFDLFQQMAANKRLPKYQLERRIDVIIAIFLPEIVHKCLGWEVEIVAPEFPLKKADNNQSRNVDYLLFRRGDGASYGDAWVFFELKTDCSSARMEQWETYLDAADRGMPTLSQELQLIAKATNQRQKYNELQRLLDGRKTDCPIKIVYLSPGSQPPVGMPPEVRFISFAQLQEIEMEKHAEVWELFKSLVLPSLC